MNRRNTGSLERPKTFNKMRAVAGVKCRASKKQFKVQNDYDFAKSYNSISFNQTANIGNCDLLNFPMVHNRRNESEQTKQPLDLTVESVKMYNTSQCSS